MIPEFNVHGLLPGGVHVASLTEVMKRFGREGELRQVQAQSLRWTVGLARSAHVRRFVVNGSWVTHELEPNDIDCVLLIDDLFDLKYPSAVELIDGLPFIELQLVQQADFDLLVDSFFATDRLGRLKGVVEILL